MATPAPDTRISIVVVTWNSGRVLPDLLASLDAGMAGTTWELVVADNASHDGTVDLVRRLRPDARVVETGRNAGYSGGINAGAAATTLGGALLVLNADVRLTPGFGTAVLGALARPGVGIVAPRLTDRAGVTWASQRRDPSITTAWAEALLGGRQARRLGLAEQLPVGRGYERSRPVEWAVGAVLAISARCRNTVGPWDETFFLYSEEVDYCQRARRAGFEVRYHPGAVAEHDSNVYGADARLWTLVLRNRIELYGRHHGPIATAAFRAGLAVGEGIRLLRRPASRPGLRQVLGLSDATWPLHGPVSAEDARTA